MLLTHIFWCSIIHLIAMRFIFSYQSKYGGEGGSIVRGRCALGDVRALTDYRPAHPRLFSLFPLHNVLIPSSSSITIVLLPSPFSIPTELPLSSPISISSDFHPPPSIRPLELPLYSFSIASVLFPSPFHIVPLLPPFSFLLSSVLPPSHVFFLSPTPHLFPLLFLHLCYFLHSSSTSYLPPPPHPRVLLLFSLSSPLSFPFLSGSVFFAVSRLF